MNTTGAISLAGAQLQGTLLNGFAPEVADLFFIIVNNGATAVRGAFAQGTTAVIGSQTFNISYTGNFTGNPATSTFVGGNDVVLQLVIPEPGTALLAFLGMAALGLRRRRA